MVFLTVKFFQSFGVEEVEKSYVEQSDAKKDMGFYTFNRREEEKVWHGEDRKVATSLSVLFFCI